MLESPWNSYILLSTAGLKILFLQFSFFNIKKIAKIIFLSIRSKNLEMSVKKSNDLYLKTKGVNFKLARVGNMIIIKEDGSVFVN